MDDLFLLGRIIFGGFFIYNGAHHFLATASMAQYAAAKGVPMPEAAVIAAGLLLLCGGLSILFGCYTQLGIACIVLFFVAVTPVMHAFWTEEGAARAADLVNFTKNIALMGGALTMLGVPRPWPLSLERRPRVAA